MAEIIRHDNPQAIPWATVRSTMSSEVAAGPYAGTSADSFTTDNVSGAQEAIAIDYNMSGSIQFVDNVNHIFSVHLKDVDTGWAQVRVYNITGQSNWQYFNLSTGATGTASADVDQSGATDIGDGWYRCWIRFNPGTDDYGSLRVQLADADGDANVVRNSGKSIQVYGALVEDSDTISPYVASGLTFSRDLARPLARDLARQF